MTNTNLKPKIRFIGFDADWEQRKFKELVNDGILDAPLDGNHGGKHPTSNDYVELGIPFLMASDVHDGKVDIEFCKFITEERAEHLDKGFARNGDVLLTHKATIGETAILQGLKTEYAVLTPQVTYYRIQKEEKLSPKYLYAFFNSISFQNDLKAKAAQSTRPYIGISAQQNLNIVLPKNHFEQEKIGTYFLELDNLITLHQRKYDKLKTMKKACLEKMFPKEGEKVPEIRFKGFTKPWEQRKLENVANYRNGKAHENEIDDNGEYIVVNSKFVSTNGEVKKYSCVQNEPLLENEIAFVLSDVPNGRAIARTFLVDKSNKYTLNQRIAGITPYNDTDPYYLYIKMNRNPYFLRFDDGNKQTNLSINDVLNYEDMYPSYEEQQKIGQFFGKLDKTITLHQRELQKLKNIKKALLEKMFV